MTASLRVPEARVRQQLTEAIQASVGVGSGEDLRLLRTAFQTWDKRNEILLDRAFEKQGFLDLSPKDEYASAVGLCYPFGLELAGEITAEGILTDLDVKKSRLQQILETLDVYGDDDASVDSPSSGNPTIFVVHGRSDAPRLEVELLIRRASKLEPIILQDQANRGSTTLIEKLEEHLGSVSVAFAVIVMTGDDEGALKGGELQARARQNVILELGFAMSALGRRRVAILHEEGIELPSDIAGVAYYPLDTAGAWKARLLGELTVAGLEVDPQALL